MTPFRDVRISGDNAFGNGEFGTTLSESTLDSEYAVWRAWRTLDSEDLDAEDLLGRFSSGLRLVPKLYWLCAMYMCDVN